MKIIAAYSPTIGPGRPFHRRGVGRVYRHAGECSLEKAVRRGPCAGEVNGRAARFSSRRGVDLRRHARPYFERAASGLDQPPQAVAPQPAGPEAAIPPRLFPEDVPPAHASLLPSRPASGAEPRQGGRGRRRGRARRQPQSKHTFEVCLRFVTYQKEVLGHDHIWNATGLARHLHLSGEQDEEIDAWLSDQASSAA